MGFFQQQTPQKAAGNKPAPNRDDINRATRLHAALYEARLLTHKVTITNWAHEFRILRDFAPADEIESTLTWYLANMRGRYTPRVFSAAGFRKRYAALRAAIEREADAAAVEIPDCLRAALDRLRIIRWPAIIAPAIDQITARSYHAYAAHLIHLNRLAGQLAAADPMGLRPFLTHYLAGLPDPVTFAEQWSARVAINGGGSDPTIYAFRPTHRRYIAEGKQAAYNYCGDAAPFRQILEMIHSGD